MLPGTTDQHLGDYLLRIARDPEVGLRVYEHLRDYCHQCRNRLNSLKLSIYLAIRQSPSNSAEPWLETERHYRALEYQVEQIQRLCRPMVLSRVTLGLDLLIDDRRDAWTQQMVAWGKNLEIIAPEQRAVASFDVDCLGRALDAVVAWRASTRSDVRSAKMRWCVEDEVITLTWEEPSWVPSEDDHATSPEGVAWTLPLLARVAIAHGGDYRIDTEGGWFLELSWPTKPITL